MGRSPHLGPTSVLQLQVLLHENMVDLVENDAHAISGHQRQVPVALQEMVRGEGQNNHTVVLSNLIV